VGSIGARVQLRVGPAGEGHRGGGWDTEGEGMQDSCHKVWQGQKGWGMGAPEQWAVHGGQACYLKSETSEKALVTRRMATNTLARWATREGTRLRMVGRAHAREPGGGTSGPHKTQEHPALKGHP